MKEQNYSNHTALYPPFHYVVVPFLLVYAIRAIWLLVQTPNADHAWSAAFAFVVLLGAFTARGMALKVQDRVIRLEMRLRMRELLPADLIPRIPEFTAAQLVALRFASDRELPALARQVLEQRMNNRKAIKQLVKEWQADHLRA